MMLEVKTLQKLIDKIYILFFGKYTLSGFVNKTNNTKRCNYIFDSVFPNEEIMSIALQHQHTIPQSNDTTNENISFIN